MEGVEILPSARVFHGDRCALQCGSKGRISLLSHAPPFMKMKISYFHFRWTVCVCVAQSFLALCDPMDHSPPGSTVQVKRVLEKTCFFLPQLYLKSPRVASYSGTSALLFKCSGIACCIVILVYSIFFFKSQLVCCKELGSCIFSSPKRERGKVWHWIALLWYMMTKES